MSRQDFSIDAMSDGEDMYIIMAGEAMETGSSWRPESPVGGVVEGTTTTSCEIVEVHRNHGGIPSLSGARCKDQALPSFETLKMYARQGAAPRLPQQILKKTMPPPEQMPSVFQRDTI